MNGRTPQPGMSMIVKNVTRSLRAFILLFGVYIVLYGHLTPGGGFSGGVIVACSLILLTLAEGQDATIATIGRSFGCRLGDVGALAFFFAAVFAAVNAVTAVTMYVAGLSPEAGLETGPFRFRLISGGTIPLHNIAILFKVSAGLFLVFSVLAAAHVAIRGRRRRRGKGAER